MKGKKCIKLLILCITCLLSLSLYSNANALIYSGLQLKPTGNTWTSVGGKIITEYPTLTTTIDSNRHVRFSDTTVRLINIERLEYPSNITVDKDKYYVFTIGFQNYDIEKPIIWNFESSDSNFKILSIQPQSDQQLFDRTYCFQYTMSNNVWSCTNAGGNIGDRVTVYFDVVLKPNNSGSYKPQIINTDSFFKFYYGAAIGDTLVYVSDLWEYEETGTGADKQYEQEQQDRNDIEQQSDSTEQQAESVEDEATQTGTSLFNAFTQLLGALTNVNGNSCTLPAMQVYSLNLGNMNLCQYDIPPQIMALVSIGMVFIIIPLGINLVKRMISLYKEITG